MMATAPGRRLLEERSEFSTLGQLPPAKANLFGFAQKVAIRIFIWFLSLSLIFFFSLLHSSHCIFLGRPASALVKVRGPRVAKRHVVVTDRAVESFVRVAGRGKSELASPKISEDNVSSAVLRRKHRWIRLLVYTVCSKEVSVFDVTRTLQDGVDFEVLLIYEFWSGNRKKDNFVNGFAFSWAKGKKSLKEIIYLSLHIQLLIVNLFRMRKMFVRQNVIT